MYIPEYFKVTDQNKMYDFIKTYNFGILNTYDPLSGEIITTHLPLILEFEENRSILYGHIAKDNNHWKVLKEHPEVQIIFSGPHAYISPRFYISKSVPTWNYTTVHVTGQAFLIDSETVLQDILIKLVNFHEKSANGQLWSLSELNPDYVSKLMREIVGVKIYINKLEAQFKINQNKTHADILKVISSLEQGGYLNQELAFFMKNELSNNIK